MKKETGYAFLSNSRTSVLEKEGEIVWFPCPRFDSKSIFSKILDEKIGGSFSIRPEGKYKVSTSYIGNSLVAKSTFSTPTGKLEVTDFLPLGLPSIIRIFDSDVPFTVGISPMFNYGKTYPKIEVFADGIRFKNPESEESFEISIKGRFRNCENGNLKFDPGKGHMLTL
ncbi:glycoside hydrolase 15, partial [mine drainage metagenome]